MTDAPRHLPDRPSSVRHSHQPDIHTIGQTLAGICQTLATEVIWQARTGVRQIFTEICYTRMRMKEGGVKRGM